MRVCGKGELALGEMDGERVGRPAGRPTAAPITLTLILSQDGRGDKMGGDGGYAKVSIKGEGIRGPSREKGEVRGRGCCCARPLLSLYQGCVLVLGCGPPY